MIKKPPEAAGGLSAIFSTLRVSLRQMGFFRSLKTLANANQKTGFDCPGCAWPDPEDKRAATEFCENGAKAIADIATKKKVTTEFFQGISVAELRSKNDQWLNDQGRITAPVILESGATHYKAIEWESAFSLIAKNLKSLADPNEAIFYTSGRTSNEAAFLYQLMVRKFGTNNLPDCSNLCHESSGVALKEVIGSGKGTVLLSDFKAADCIFIVGQNPGSNHPRMLTALEEAAKRGAKIISINPLLEIGTKAFRHPQNPMSWVGKPTPLASSHLAIDINGDGALFQGIAKAVFEGEMNNPGASGRLDLNFIQNYTDGFESYRSNIESVKWEEITLRCGISQKQIEEVAEIYCKSERTIFCWAMGVTQHVNAVATIQEMVNVLLLKGNFGKKGAGVCPVRGHSNVQGDRTMGIWEAPSESFLDSLASEFKFSPPSKHGFNTVEAILAMKDKRAKIFFALGGNFLSACPDTGFTESALSNCELIVNVATKLNRTHLVSNGSGSPTSIILPCLGRTEKDLNLEGQAQFVTVENSMGVVHRSLGKLPPADSCLKSEAEIICDLAENLFEPTIGFDWKAWKHDYSKIRERIGKVIPDFDGFNEKIKKPGGFTLPHLVRDNLQFDTKTEKARFSRHRITKPKRSDSEFFMMTIRSHDQFNTTIYSADDRYRGIKNCRDAILMNLEDMEQQNLKAGDRVCLKSSPSRKLKNLRVVPYSIPRRCVATYFPESNVLIPTELYAEKSFTPAFKSVPVQIER